VRDTQAERVLQTEPQALSRLRPAQDEGLANTRIDHRVVVQAKEGTRMDSASQPVVDRQASIDRFRETRQRTAGMFDLLTEEAYYEQPIPLRHPVVFYEGHIPAFSVNTLIKRGLAARGKSRSY